MKFLSRMLMVVVLLSGLAYGSFAFGKYVLSSKLFGEDVNSVARRDVSRSTTEASAVTRQTGWKGDKPRVDVKVLPADQTSSGQLSTYADDDVFNRPVTAKDKGREEASSEPTPDPPARLGNRKFDDGGASYSLGEESPKPRTRRRRTRTRKTTPTPKPATNTDSAETVASTSSSGSGSDSGGSNNRSSSGSSGSSSSNSSSGGSSSGSGGDSARTTVSSGSSSTSRASESTRASETPRRSERRSTSQPRRERSRRETTASPVPRPEGQNSSGGDRAGISPVPRPE